MQLISPYNHLFMAISYLNSNHNLKAIYMGMTVYMYNFTILKATSLKCDLNEPLFEEWQRNNSEEIVEINRSVI